MALNASKLNDLIHSPEHFLSLTITNYDKPQNVHVQGVTIPIES